MSLKEERVAMIDETGRGPQQSGINKSMGLRFE